MQSEYVEKEERRGPEPTRAAQCPICEAWNQMEHCCGELFGVFRKTNLEFMKAFRNFLDTQIDHMEHCQEEEEPKARATKINIDEE